MGEWVSVSVSDSQNTCSCHYAPSLIPAQRAAIRLFSLLGKGPDWESWGPGTEELTENAET